MHACAFNMCVDCICFTREFAHCSKYFDQVKLAGRFSLRWRVGWKRMKDKLTRKVKEGRDKAQKERKERRKHGRMDGKKEG